MVLKNLQKHPLASKTDVYSCFFGTSLQKAPKERVFIGLDYLVRLSQKRVFIVGGAG